MANGSAGPRQPGGSAGPRQPGGSADRRRQPVSEALLEEMERSRELGFLGPGRVRDHVEHAEGFAVVADAAQATTGAILDLGSGGGIPGLVLAERWRERSVVLLDASERRTTFLSEVVSRLGWQDRIQVIRARAEDAGRDPTLRGAHAIVVARGFGPPPVTAECAAPFLGVGGVLIVSEPPDSGGPLEPSSNSRWPAPGLGILGMRPGNGWDQPFHYRAIHQEIRCPDRFPRRDGLPKKRPLF
jgi:16S rRNA (guanine527-N7)-methyltransferase